jgi:hypothetical protein
MINKSQEIEDIKQGFNFTSETDPTTGQDPDQQSSVEEKIFTEDDLHEIQVDDDIEEPDPESFDYTESENEEESD